MAHQKCKIVLFIDNYKAHPKAITLQLNSIKVEFMPSNTTSKLQPLDQGVIQKFKVKYCLQIEKKCIVKTNEGTCSKWIGSNADS